MPLSYILVLEASTDTGHYADNNQVSQPIRIITCCNEIYETNVVKCFGAVDQYQSK